MYEDTSTTCNKGTSQLHLFAAYTCSLTTNLCNERTLKSYLGEHNSFKTSSWPSRLCMLSSDAGAACPPNLIACHTITAYNRHMEA